MRPSQNAIKLHVSHKEIFFPVNLSSYFLILGDLSVTFHAVFFYKAEEIWRPKGVDNVICGPTLNQLKEKRMLRLPGWI